MADSDAVLRGFRRLKAEQHGGTEPPGIVQRWVVGSGEGCPVRVDDPYVTLRHCEVARTDARRYYVRDLGSLNGTWLRSGDGRQARVYGWTLWVSGQALVVGRSVIPQS